MLGNRKEVIVEVSRPASSGRIIRLSKFGAVGMINTVIDFVLYNVLSDKVGLTLVQSNIVSTTAAMLFSFVANKKLVFKKTDGRTAHQLVLFFAITAFGLYVLQNGTIVLLTNVWHWPMHMVLLTAHIFGIDNHDPFIIKNGAKAAATVISLSWNYIMYRRVVFR